MSFQPSNASFMELLVTERDTAVQLAREMSVEMEALRHTVTTLHGAVQAREEERDRYMALARDMSGEVEAARPKAVVHSHEGDVLRAEVRMLREKDRSQQAEISGLRSELRQAMIALEAIRHDWDKVRSTVDVLQRNAALSPRRGGPL
jgi:ABC-type phosphate transport system auxiliary subunit